MLNSDFEKCSLQRKPSDYRHPQHLPAGRGRQDGAAKNIDAADLHQIFRL